MRRTFVKALVLAVPAICGSGAAYAQPPSLEDEQTVHMATLERDWIPAGSLPIPPKPKASEDRDDTGIDECPSSAPVIPPKPKAAAWVDDSTALPAGGLIVPPKPKARDDGETGADEYPSGSPIIPPKPKLTSNIQY